MHAQVAGMGLFLLLLQGLSEGWLLGSLARDDPSTARLSLLPASLRFLSSLQPCALALLDCPPQPQGSISSHTFVLLLPAGTAV